MNAPLMTAARPNAAPACMAPVQRPGDCLPIIVAEYREMPGLSLTGPQAARLWNLAAAEANASLRELVAAGFLCCDRTGRYVRVDVLRD